MQYVRYTTQFLLTYYLQLLSKSCIVIRCANHTLHTLL